MSQVRKLHESSYLWAQDQITALRRLIAPKRSRSEPNPALPGKKSVDGQVVRLFTSEYPKSRLTAMWAYWRAMSSAAA